MGGNLRSSHVVKVLAVCAVLPIAMACGTGASPSASSKPPASSPTSSSPPPSGLVMVSIGDSIPFNSPDDCPGCTGFVEQYAKAVEQATGRRVSVQNLSKHTGLTLTELVDGLDSLKPDLVAADVIVVGIAHNSFELNADAPCGRPVVDDSPDWSVVDAQCATKSSARFAPVYDALYSRIAEWRKGKPTVLRTVNRYNDWIPASGTGLTREQARKTTVMHDAWNAMLCSRAAAHGFGCADIYHAFNGPDGTKPSADLLAEDYTHPSQLGNDTIAGVLKSQGFAPLA